MSFNSLINQINSAILSSESINNKPHSIEILKHSKNYSNLLDIYVKSTKQNITMKKWFKIFFFIVTMCSLISIVYLFYMTLQYVFNNFNKFDSLNSVTFEAILSMITVVIPAILSLIVAFIKIPEIIAQYLFNAEEDNNMISIIKNIQDYDKTMFSIEQQSDNLLKNQKDQNAEVEDDAIKEPPSESTN